MTDMDYRNLLSPEDESENNENWYQHRNQIFTQFKDTVQEWFSQKASDELMQTHQLDIPL